MGAWFPIKEALKKINPGQVGLIYDFSEILTK
jgi:hypothetical protein